MSKEVVLPADIVQAISMLKSTPIDPSDFNNAVQECYNRGFGKMGKWIMDHKDQYLEALQNGYVSDAEVPKSEPSDTPPPPPIVSSEVNPEDGGVPGPKDNEIIIDDTTLESAQSEDKAPEQEPETAAASTLPDAEEEEPAGKRHKRS